MKEMTTPKEAAILALLKEADKLGYEVEWVAGDNGSFQYWKHLIKIGKNHSLDDRIIVLSHEIGHGQDYRDNPPGAQELILMTCFSKEWQVSEHYYKRERRAWDYATLLLKELEVWETIRFSFGAYKKSALSAYYQRHIRAKEEGKDKPEKLLFDKVYYELTDTSREG